MQPASDADDNNVYVSATDEKTHYSWHYYSRITINQIIILLLGIYGIFSLYFNRPDIRFKKRQVTDDIKERIYNTCI